MSDFRVKWGRSLGWKILRKKGDPSYGKMISKMGAGWWGEAGIPLQTMDVTTWVYNSVSLIIKMVLLELVSSLAAPVADKTQ